MSDNCHLRAGDEQLVLTPVAICCLMQMQQVIFGPEEADGDLNE